MFHFALTVEKKQVRCNCVSEQTRSGSRGRLAEGLVDDGGRLVHRVRLFRSVGTGLFFSRAPVSRVRAAPPPSSATSFVGLDQGLSNLSALLKYQS